MATGRQIMVRVSEEEFAEIEAACHGNKQAWMLGLIRGELHPERPATPTGRMRRATVDHGRPPHVQPCHCGVCEPPKPK